MLEKHLGELNLDAVVKVYKFEQVGDTDEWKLSQEWIWASDVAIPQL